MNISLPQPLREWVQEQVSQGGFSTASEYVRDVLRREQLLKARQRVDAMLTEALDEGPSTPMTKSDWEHIRTEGLKRAGRRPRK